MTAFSKLAAVFAATTLALALAGDVSAKTKPVKPTPAASEQTAQPPSPPPQQFIVAKGVEPLTPEREQSWRPKDSFKECLADGGCNGDKGNDRGLGRGRMPADGINFEQAKSYLAWLSRKVGRTYRLPSESEREYFARAGTTTPFWFGKTISAQNANYDASNNYPGSPYGEASKGPKVVDSYLPNKFGLYQVNGNAEEWTEDCYNKRYTEDTPTDGSPWLEGDCSKRMLRGGGWIGMALTQRSGYRNETKVVAGYSFRVVRTLNVE
jgi:formylglycine-generating enzyme required for sulfatase activity